MVRNGTWPLIAESYQLANDHAARDVLDQIPCVNQRTLKWLQSIATCQGLDYDPTDRWACMPQETFVTPQSRIRHHGDISSSSSSDESKSDVLEADPLSKQCRKIPRLGEGAPIDASSRDSSDDSDVSESDPLSKQPGKGAPTNASGAYAYWDSRCCAVCDL
jgi:hypothetical protein